MVQNFKFPSPIVANIELSKKKKDRLWDRVKSFLKFWKCLGDVSVG